MAIDSRLAMLLTVRLAAVKDNIVTQIVVFLLGVV